MNRNSIKSSISGTYISLFDSSPSQGPLGVEPIQFEPRACILMTLSSAFMNKSNVSPHLFIYFLSTKSVMAGGQFLKFKTCMIISFISS